MSTAIALDAAWVVAAVLVAIVFGATGLAIRRMLLDRGGGTVECGLRRPGGTWRLGVAAYEEDELRWYDAVGVLLTPEEVLARRTLSVESRREVYPTEAALLGPGKVVVACTAGEPSGTVERAIGAAAPTRCLAWLQAAPPTRAARAGGARDGGPGPGPRRGERSALAAGLPEHVAAAGVGPAGEDEQQVRQPVQVPGGDRVHRVRVRVQGRPRAALRPADHRARRVQQRRPGRATGQHEAAQRGQPLVVLGARPLQVAHVVLVDRQRRVLGVSADRVAQIRPHIEQLVLDPGQQRPEPRVEPAERERGADRTVGLVHVRVGGEPGVVLAHAAAVAERG